jgi:aminopeptidase YwaD
MCGFQSWEDSMKKAAFWLVLMAAACFCLSPLFTQEREDRTLLSWEQMRAIINEVSGERPLHTTMELVGYPRIRPRSEYEGNFQESVVLKQRAIEAGLQNVEIESFPSGGSSWAPVQGELWMVSPESRKLYDIYDIAISICSGSESGEVTADLVDVGSGARAEDYAGKEVSGKIVLGSAGSSSLQRLGVFERGAVGILSYTSLHPEPQNPDEILSQSVSANAPQGRKAGFGWSIAPRIGRELAARLARGEKVTLRSVIKAESFPSEMETVHAVLPGDGSSNQAIAISGHLYEGVLKQGANDDASGCALGLEMGRAFKRMIDEGKLPRPKRDIHFLWVPEISGTRAWLQKHPEVTKRLVADLNYDMEGLGLSIGSTQWVMHRTPDTFPTFLNDLCANVLRFVGNLNQERVRYRSHGYGFTWPVVAPSGSKDPFYYVIEKYYGASDHQVYMSMGVPSIMFITWPDPFYHSSQDTPDKLDATQFKRAGVVGAAAMTILATAGDEMAAKVTAEALARGAERMGQAESKGMSYLADAQNAAALAEAYKNARASVKHQAGIEKATVQTSAVLYANPADAEKKLAAFEPLVDQRANALLNEVKAFYEVEAQRLNLRLAEPALTAEEALAAKTVVERVGGQQGGGGGGARGGGGGASAAPGAQADRAALQAATNKIPQHMSSELNLLLGQNKTVLEIRDFLTGEFEPLPLADLMEYLRAQEKVGALKLTVK